MYEVPLTPSHPGNYVQQFPHGRKYVVDAKAKKHKGNDALPENISMA
jgi:hypothetical protein